MALRTGAHAICEKPLVLNPWNLDALLALEKETGKRVYTILQLRLHPSIIALKEKIAKGLKDAVYDVDLTYLTSRGNWYYASWKGDIEKSGGIASNIGIHFYDMLSWIFGNVKQNKVHLNSHDRAAGYLEFEQARVKWFLSIDPEMLPVHVKEKGQRTYRSITIDGEEIEFSGGFTELHTKSYQDIVRGNGFGLEDARQSIEIVHAIRNSEVSEREYGKFHAFVDLPISKHPFKR
jgi:UDP-N-acetyl-2-amino-2-deoxyglucuronate dehydrogenase